MRKFTSVGFLRERYLVKALYDNRLCSLVETSSDVTLADEGRQFTVSFDDQGLVVDPTDTQVADADNLGQWYGLGHEAASSLRSMLRCDWNSAHWQKTKTE